MIPTDDKPTFGDWCNVAKQWGLKKIGDELKGACPVCGGTDRFHVKLISYGDALIGCRGCMDGQPRGTGFAEVLAVVFPDRAHRREKVYTKPSCSFPRFAGHDLPRVRTPKTATGATVAQRIWAAATLADDSPTRVYLAKRRCFPPSGTGGRLPNTVRCLSKQAAPRRCKGWSGLPDGAHCAAVFAYHTTAGDVQAVMLEALSARGERLPGIKRWRRTVGEKKGCVFCAGEHFSEAAGIVVTEGEVSAMAARWIYPKCIVLATGGTAGLQAWRPSSTQTSLPVIIEADGDLEGSNAARTLQAALDAQGVTVRVVWRDLELGYDTADDLAKWLLERAASAEHKGKCEKQTADVAAWQCLISNEGFIMETDNSSEIFKQCRDNWMAAKAEDEKMGRDSQRQKTAGMILKQITNVLNIDLGITADAMPVVTAIMAKLPVGKLTKLTVRPKVYDALGIRQAVAIPDVNDKPPAPLLSAYRQGGAVLSEGSVCLLTGAGGIAKTALALTIACDMAAIPDNECGKTICGGIFTASKGGAVLFVTYEDPPSVLASKARGLATQRGSSNALARVHLLELSGRPLYGNSSGYNTPPKQMKGWLDLRLAVEQIAPKMVIIDPALAAFVGESNAAAPVRTFLGELTQLAKANACGVLLITHSSKATRGRSDSNDRVERLFDAGQVGGSTHWSDGVRGVLTMAWHPDKQVAAGKRVLAIPKANWGAAGIAIALNMVTAESGAILGVSADGNWQEQAAWETTLGERNSSNKRSKNAGNPLTEPPAVHPKAAP